MSWEKEEREKGMTRREWVRVGMAAGAVGAVLGLGGLSIGQILPPPLKFSGEIRETIQYTKFPPTDPTADLWWNSKAGTAVKVSDFTQDWKGATGAGRVDNTPPPFGDYSSYTGGAVVPTYNVFGVDPVYCICHGSQYEPMVLVVNTNDKSGAQYVGAWRVHGPAPRALPVIPVKAQGLNLVGGMANPPWYVYC